MTSTRRPPLRSLTIFEVAARHSSFLRASDELCMTTSAVSHHIKQLEGFLGTSLFERTNRGVRLTNEGAAYFQTVRAAINRIDDGTREILKWRRTEELTIRCGASFAIRWLLPRLPLFLMEAPHIDVKILTQTQSRALTKAVDVEIKYGHVDTVGNYVEPLKEENIIPMCSPALFRTGQPFESVDDIRYYRLIESEKSILPWSTWMATNRVAANTLPRLVFDNSYLAVQAAASGLGIVLEGDFLASEELASGRLVAPAALRQTAVSRPLRFVVVPEAMAGAERVNMFRDWLSRTIVCDSGVRTL